MRKRIRFCFLLLVLPLALQQGTQLESLAQPPAEEEIGQEAENGAISHRNFHALITTWRLRLPLYVFTVG